MREDVRGSGEISLADPIIFFERRWRLIVGLALAWSAMAVLLVLILVPKEFTAAATLVAVPPSFASHLNPEPISLQSFRTLLESGSVIAETPEKAARIANTWAEVYLDFTSNLMTKATTTTVNFIETQYPEIDRELIALEDHLVAIKGEYQKEYDQLAGSWDKWIAASRKETLDKITAFQLETRAVMEALVSDQLKTLITNDATAGDIKEKLRKLASVRTELAQTSAVLKLEKTVSDNALWQSVILQDLWDENLSSVRERLLKTQEVNPVYGELALKAVELETELRGLGSAQARSLAEATATLERGQGERPSGLAKLEGQRALEPVIQRRRRQRELDSVEREQETKVDQIGREIKVLRGLHQRLADNYNEAVLAKAQEDIEVVHLASRAVPVENEEPRRVLLIGALGSILGGILGLIIGMVLDMSAEAHSVMLPAREARG